MKIIKCGFFMIPQLTKKYWYFAGFLLGSFLRVFIPSICKLTYNNNSFDYNITNNSTNLNDIFFPNLSNIIPNLTNENKLKILFTQNYFEMLRNISSDLLIGIVLIFDYIRNKDEYKKRKEFQYYNYFPKINFIFNKETRKNYRTIKLIFIISLIDIICQLALPIKYIIEYYQENPFLLKSADHLNSFLLIDILFRYIFSRLILNTYFYAHHYFSFFLNFISLLPLFYIDYRFKYKGNYDILYIIIIGLKLILYSLEDIINKVAFTTIYIEPKTLIFYKGLFQLIVYFPIISSVFFIIDLYDFQDIRGFLLNELKLFLSFIPFNIVRTICLVNVIDRFTAQHMSFLKVSESIIIFIFYFFRGDEKNLFFQGDDKKAQLPSIIQLSSFVILLISTLIHNEIIIINCRVLKAKTEYYLDKDADREQNSSFYTDTMFSDSKEINTSSASNLYSDLTGSDIS